MDWKTMFDPDLAVLPIMVATWDNDPLESTVVYQNKVQISELGSWAGKKLCQLLDEVSGGDGIANMLRLTQDGSLILSGNIHGRDVKFHSRKGESHFQMAISDNTEINQLRDRAQRSSLINSFLNLGSHELKTPLNGIIGLTELMALDETDAEKQELLGLVRESAQVLNQTVSKMLDMIYADKRGDPADALPEALNINTILQQNFSLFQKHLVDRDFSESSFFLNSVSEVAVPSRHFIDIITELAINLRRNTPPNKKIEIFTVEEESSVRLIVENECGGIPSESLTAVFEPFFRYQNAAGHSSGYEYGQGGVGMGLTVVKKYMDAVGGKVWFENKADYIQGKENVVQMTFVFPKA